MVIKLPRNETDNLALAVYDGGSTHPFNNICINCIPLVIACKVFDLPDNSFPDFTIEHLNIPSDMHLLFGAELFKRTQRHMGCSFSVCY